MSDILIKDVSLASGVRTDLGIHATRFVDTASLVQPVVINASGLMALPGLVDLHTHLREPSPQPAETISSGTLAAAKGGFTAVFAMANTDPVTDTASAVRNLRTLAADAHAEVIPVGAITRGLQGREVSEIEAMNDEGVNFFSDDGFCVMDASIMREALLRVGYSGGVVAQHSQDHNIAGPCACVPDGVEVPPLAEEDTTWHRVAEASIIARDVQLAMDTGTHLHICHISTAEAVDVVRWAKEKGAPVTAEVTPHHLLLGSELVGSLDTRFKVNPPLRNDEDRHALRLALADGTIDVVGTDHAPHLPSDKEKPFPQAKPGMVGLEWALGVVIETMINTGLMDWVTLAKRTSHTPARIGKISYCQGRPLAISERATFTLIDLTRRAIVDKDLALTQGRNNPYHGLDLPDPVLATFWEGRPTYASFLFES
ncbi:MAG: dihydroorotase [Propionibacteriaceae bacterium]|jgi:dihydroorotase|nr:dihydroorotase [Propionibacteriaceae bacterium]